MRTDSEIGGIPSWAKHDPATCCECRRLGLVVSPEQAALAVEAMERRWPSHSRPGFALAFPLPAQTLDVLRALAGREYEGGKTDG